VVSTRARYTLLGALPDAARDVTAIVQFSLPAEVNQSLCNDALSHLILDDSYCCCLIK
jgi:hypothetical protein